MMVDERMKINADELKHRFGMNDIIADDNIKIDKGIGGVRADVNDNSNRIKELESEISDLKSDLEAIKTILIKHLGEDKPVQQPPVYRPPTYPPHYYPLPPRERPPVYRMPQPGYPSNPPAYRMKRPSYPGDRVYRKPLTGHPDIRY